MKIVKSKQMEEYQRQGHKVATDTRFIITRFYEIGKLIFTAREIQEFARFPIYAKSKKKSSKAINPNITPTLLNLCNSKHIKFLGVCEYDRSSKYHIIHVDHMLAHVASNYCVSAPVLQFIKDEHWMIYFAKKYDDEEYPEELLPTTRAEKMPPKDDNIVLGASPDHESIDILVENQRLKDLVTEQQKTIAEQQKMIFHYQRGAYGS